MNNVIKKSILHVKTVLAHKHIVFCLAVKAGIPIRGLLHDLSKFSPTELFESIKFYEDGKQSPILKCIEVKGYSNAWIHHTKYNKHHLDYWIFPHNKYGALLIPYNCWVELICDNLAAGINYHKKDWTKEHQLKFWEEKMPSWKSVPGHFIHPAIESATIEVFKQVSLYGIEKVISKKNLKEIYAKNTKGFL